jgi:hypothetical protein
MQRGFAVRLGTIVLAAVWLSTPALAQSGGLPCDAFQKNPDGSWSAMRNVSVPGPGRYFNVQQGALFRPGASFMGQNLAAQLDRDCLAEAAAATAPPQVELPKLAGPSGII